MFTNDDAFAAKLRSFAFHGKGETQYDNIHVGLNSRLDTLQAAILIEKLAILEEEMVARQAVAQRYADGLGDVVKVAQVPAGQPLGMGAICDRDARPRRAQGASPGQRHSLGDLLREAAAPAGRLPEFPAGARRPCRFRRRLPERILCLPMHPYLARTTRTGSSRRSAISSAAIRQGSPRNSQSPPRAREMSGRTGRVTKVARCLD